MKRLIIVSLLLILPLQAAWAAASAYCRHERGVAAQHFAHHVHQHHAFGNGDSGTGPASGFHPDCMLCHLSSVGAVATLLDVTPPPPPFAIVPAENILHSSIFPEGPERPKWRAAA